MLSKETLEIIVIVAAIVPIVGNILALILRRTGHYRAAEIADKLTPIAAGLGQVQSREQAIRVVVGVADAAVEELGHDHPIAQGYGDVRRALQPDPYTWHPPLPVLLLVFVVGCVPILGCGSPLQTAATVANVASEAGHAAAPVLRDHCVEPMQSAASAQDVARAKAIADRCDAPVLAYESLRVAHVALRGTIVAVAAGGDPGKLLVLVAEVSAAAQDLAVAIESVTTGGAR